MGVRRTRSKVVEYIGRLQHAVGENRACRSFRVGSMRVARAVRIAILLGLDIAAACNRRIADLCNAHFKDVR